MGVDLYTPDGNLRSLAEIKRDILRLAIVHYDGCGTQIARHLKIGRSTFYRQLPRALDDKP